jgi:hypothetical protein
LMRMANSIQLLMDKTTRENADSQNCCTSFYEKMHTRSNTQHHDDDERRCVICVLWARAQKDFGCREQRIVSME